MTETVVVSAVPSVDELRRSWDSWHAEREADLATPHGWLSLTGFYWLSEQPTALGTLPGAFHAETGEAVLTASLDDGYAAEGQLVDGQARAEIAEAGSRSWLRRDNVVIELVRRGGRYAIRLRDPEAVTRTRFTGVPAFPVQREWVLDGIFTPLDAPTPVSVATARADLVQEVTVVGHVAFAVDGVTYRLAAAAWRSGELVLAFHDETNGTQTAGWRSVITSPPDESGRVRIDFNRAVNFPYAFTDYGTCPAPVAGNSLPIPVTAGEQSPHRPDRGVS